MFTSVILTSFRESWRTRLFCEKCHCCADIKKVQIFNRFDSDWFPENCNVEEITFKTCITPFRFLNKVLDALPNIKKVQIFNCFDSDFDFDLENLPVFLKNISSLKYLKSLNVKIMSYHKNNGFDAQKFEHILEIIKNNFPMNSEVTVELNGRNEALIDKKEGENPKFFLFFGSTKILVNGLCQ